MSFSCKFCNAKFTFRTNRNRHQTNLNPDEAGVPVYRCQHCDFTTRDLRTLERYFRNRHNRLVKCCLYCYIGFDSADRFAIHIRDQHGLPSRTSETSRRPTESAFQGALQVFTIDGTEDDQDLMQFMLNNRDIITDLIKSEVSNAAKKVQFVVSLDLYKGRNKNDNEEQAIEIFASSEMTTVYLNGLSNEDFFKMSSKMLNILFMFSSQGSGWILRKVNRLEIKKAAVAPVHASS